MAKFSYAGRIEEMSIDEVRRLLHDSGMDHLIDNYVDASERPYTRSRTEFNLILPERGLQLVTGTIKRGTRLQTVIGEGINQRSLGTLLCS